MINLFDPRHLQSLSTRYGLKPSKAYGQNFLIDEEIIRRIIQTAGLSKEDTIVEVGPGFGVLTFPLAAKAGKVISFEIEKKLQPYWEEKLNKKNCHPEQSEGSSFFPIGGRNKEDSSPAKTQNDNLRSIEIIWGNVLNQFSIYNLQFSKYKVVSNLPYQITSPLIRMFLEAENPPTEMVLMVQKEVAERICARPGDMSLLSVSVQYYADAKLEFVVPRSSFWPAPEVDSAVIMIRNKKQETRNKKNDAEFFKIVKAGFANRRKLLMKNLEAVVGKKNKEMLKKSFDELGLLPTARAQELSVEEWKMLVEIFINNIQLSDVQSNPKSQ